MTARSGWWGGKPGQGQPPELDLLARPGAEHAHPPVDGEGGGGQPFGVTELGCSATRVEKGLAVGGIPGLTLGGAEADGQIDPHHGVGFVDLGEDLERLGVIMQCVLGRQ